MSRNMRRNMIAMLISISITILGTEAALSIFDPWGMHYFDDVATVWDHVIPHSNRIDVLPAGVYHFSNWTATQLEDYTRLVPNNQGGACKVVFVGDSLTWGHGVNDQETWTNLVAGQLPQVSAINAGFDGYNSENVNGTLIDFPDADLFVYLIIGNDAEPTTGVLRQTRASMLKKYLSYITQQLKGDLETTENKTQLSNVARFRSDIHQMSLDPRVLFVGFEEPLAQSLKPEYDIFLLPPYHHRISKADAHPNPEGHQEIAEAILPYIRDALERQCAHFTSNE